MIRFLTLTSLLLASLTVHVGCAVDDNQAPICEGSKCDDLDSSYVADFDKMNELWPSDRPMKTIEDAFTIRVDLGQAHFDSPTHLFDAPVKIIPYSDKDRVQDASGDTVDRRDAEIARYFPPGQVGYAIKHHRPEFRDLKLAGAAGDEMKEHFKLQDTHIEIVVGVERDGEPGVITLNNPQSYEDGLFGTADYPMIFVRPTMPGYLNRDEKAAFNDNIRTMVAGFNAVSNFPGDYNGGDPLGARNPDAVLEHAAMMVRAIAGDSTAKDFFDDPNNLIYCAELAHVASSAGMLAPLNARTFVPLVGQDTWSTFEKEVEKHNKGEVSAFVEMNDNKRVALVELTLAPESLESAPTIGGEAPRLAFQPMTMSDIVEQFMRTHIPREKFGEGLAGAQAAVLTQMKPGLLEAMSLDKLADTDPVRVAVDKLFADIVEVVGKDHGDYDGFRAAIAPYLEAARGITGPRDGSGNGLFVPPSLLHVTAQKKHDGGLLGIDYVGHGLHYSLVRKATTP